MDGYNFFNYIPTSDNEESENGGIPSYLHNVIENIQNFDHQKEENAEYAVMEVVPHGFTGKVSFCMSICYLSNTFRLSVNVMNNVNNTNSCPCNF